jgi:hypothetical protein
LDVVVNWGATLSDVVKSSEVKILAGVLVPAKNTETLAPLIGCPS